MLEIIGGSLEIDVRDAAYTAQGLVDGTPLCCCNRLTEVEQVASEIMLLS